MLLPGRRELLEPPFTPKMLRPDFWYDADLSRLWQDSARTTPATAADDPVGAWDNLVGGVNALQATAGLRPLLKLGVLGGRALLFDEVDDVLTVVSTPVQPFTWIAVCVTAAVGNQYIVSGAGHEAILQYFNGTTPRINSGASLDQTKTVSNPALFQGVFRGATSMNRWNGSSVTGNAGTGSPSSPLGIGNVSGGGVPFGGHIKAIIQVPRGVSEAEMRELDRYYSRRTGIAA